MKSTKVLSLKCEKDSSWQNLEGTAVSAGGQPFCHMEMHVI